MALSNAAILDAVQLAARLLEEHKPGTDEYLAATLLLRFSIPLLAQKQLEAQLTSEDQPYEN